MFGTTELIIIFCVVLVLFGGKRLPELARSIGVGIREFKKAINGTEEDLGHHKSTKDKDVDSVVIVIDPEKKEH